MTIREYLFCILLSLIAAPMIAVLSMFIYNPIIG